MTSALLTGSYDPLLVVLSLAIAIAASYTALDLAGRVRASEGWARGIWLATAALAMGGGIWAMHFVAILAFRLPLPMGHAPSLTALSLATAILVTGLGFAVVERRRGDGSALDLALGGLLMGGGIAAMHYTGMAAMQVPAALHYNGTLVVVSVLIAMGAATVALWLARRDAGPPLMKLGAAVAMSLAIAGMHYTGMAAMAWAPHDGITIDVAAHASHASSGHIGLALAVAAATLVVLILALLAALFDRRFAVLARFEAQAALAASEARFRAIVEQLGAGIAMCDGRGRFVLVNERFCDIIGRPREELLGGLRMQDVTHPDDLATNLPAFEKSISDGAPFTIEKRYLRPDSTVVWVNNSIAPVRDAEGHVTAAVAVAQDVTARRNAEIELARHRDELERLVEERTAALLRSAEERRRAEEAVLQNEKLAALGQLTGGVAHDFNNLLQVVASGTSLLRRSSYPEKRKAVILDGMDQVVQKGQALTGRMLAFARRQSLRPEIVDVGARLANMSELLRQTLGSRLRLETDIASGLWPVRVDPSQLEVAVLNLAVNARDAMPEGGTLTIQARNVTLEATPERAADAYVCIAVRDTGTGIPPHILARVVEPFFTTKELGKGTGLGLSQVHGFAKQSGGDLQIESEPGRGTVVFFHLPRAEAIPAATGALGRGAAQTEDRRPLVLQGGGRTVLVVEDNPEVATFACGLLEELGYVTRCAGSAAEALMMLSNAGASVDAVFSDVVMPGGISGVELAAALRASHPHLPVVLTTGYSDRLAMGSAPEGIETLGKPYHPDGLAAALGRALARGEMAPQEAAAR